MLCSPAEIYQSKQQAMVAGSPKMVTIFYHTTYITYHKIALVFRATKSTPIDNLWRMGQKVTHQHEWDILQSTKFKFAIQKVYSIQNCNDTP